MLTMRSGRYKIIKYDLFVFKKLYYRSKIKSKIHITMNSQIKIFQKYKNSMHIYIKIDI